MKQLDGTGLKRLHREWRRRTTRRLGLVLDSVSGPYNVGAIVRTAAAYSVDDLWLAGSTASLGASSARKTAMGTERYLEVHVEAKTLDAIAAAHELDYEVIGLELTADAMPLHDVSLRDATCFVVGHEDHGLGRDTIAACDRVAYLPLAGKVGSLNVAAAAAVALAEARRQEWVAS